MHKIIALTTPLLFAWLSVGSAAEPKPAIPSPPKPGPYTLPVKSGDFDRTPQVHIPTGYKAGTKPPLVVLLHGGGGSGTNALEKDGWAAKADEEGFRIVATEGLGTKPKLAANFKTNLAIWNSGQSPTRSLIAAVDDVAFIGEVLDELNEKVPDDDTRVFSTGHSNGGGMTFRLRAELSERFAAVGMVASHLAVEKPKPKKPLPTLDIVGTKDPLMPLDGGEVPPLGRQLDEPAGGGTTGSMGRSHWLREGREGCVRQGRREESGVPREGPRGHAHGAVPRRARPPLTGGEAVAAREQDRADPE